MGALDAEVQRLVAARRRLAAAGPEVRGTGGADRAAVGSSAEHDWSAGEVLAHVAEFVPYWQGEIARILATGNDGEVPQPFGRVATDPVRIAIVDRDRTLPPDELLDRIEWSVDRAARGLASLDDAAAARTGLHPRFGEMSVRDVVERFLVSHMEEHAEQLAAVGAP